MTFEINYDFVKGFRRDSKLVWVPTEKYLYVKKETRRGFYEYICYQTVLSDPKKKNFDKFPKCNCRVFIAEDTMKMMPRKNMHIHTLHENHEMFYKDMCSKNAIVDSVLAIAPECRSLGVNVPMQNIFTREIAKRNLGESTLRFQKMKRNLSRHVNLNETPPPNPKTHSEIEDAFHIEHVLQKYGKNMRNTEDFYTGTSVNDDPKKSFTIFSSIEVVKMIEKHIPEKNRNYLMDGTFSIRPLGTHYQVLIVYIEIELDVIPVFFVLMGGKSADAYEAVFHFIKKNVFDMKPAKFMTDFELGMRKAVKKCFPNVQLSGCWYHYSAAIRRKMLSYGLKRITAENVQAKSIFRRILRLPLLPNELINLAYRQIVEDSQNTGTYESFQRFFRYFETFWLNVHKNTLSVANQTMRTTSSLESFNAVLKRSYAECPIHEIISVFCQRFDFFKFIDRLKFHECRKAETMHNLLHDERLLRKSRNKKTETIDEKLRELTTFYTAKKISLNEYISLVMDFDVGSDDDHDHDVFDENED